MLIVVGFVPGPVEAFLAKRMGERGMISTDSHSFCSFFLFVEVQFVGLEGDPAAGFDAGVGEDGVFGFAILVGSEIDDAKVSDGCDFGVWLGSVGCCVGNEGELIAFEVHTFGVVVEVYNVVVEKN